MVAELEQFDANLAKTVNNLEKEAINGNELASQQLNALTALDKFGAAFDDESDEKNENNDDLPEADDVTSDDLNGYIKHDQEGWQRFVGSAKGKTPVDKFLADRM